VSWPWIALLVLAVLTVVAAEWPRLQQLLGSDRRKLRAREKRKAKLRVITSDDEDFVASVQRDLESLPTIEERESGPSGR
jgi:hypothetical protein